MVTENGEKSDRQLECVPRTKIGNVYINQFEKKPPPPPKGDGCER